MDKQSANHHKFVAGRDTHHFSFYLSEFEAAGEKKKTKQKTLVKYNQGEKS